MNMQEFYKEHMTGFHSAEAKDIWKEYTSEYYVMDTYYRLFHKSYGESLKSYNSDLHDLFGSVMERVEGVYTYITCSRPALLHSFLNCIRINNMVSDFRHQFNQYYFIHTWENSGIDGSISSPHQSFCYDFVSDWLHSDDLGRLFEIAKSVEDEMNLTCHMLFIEFLHVRNLQDSFIIVLETYITCSRPALLHSFLNCFQGLL